MGGKAALLVAILVSGCTQIEGTKGENGTARTETGKESAFERVAKGENGTAKTETREVNAFERVAVAGGYQLTIEVGKPTRLEIRTDEDMLPLVVTEVVGDQLKIRSQKGPRSSGSVEVAVATPRLTELRISGAVTGRVSGVDSGRFKLDISGAGSLDVQGKTGDLSLTISGAGRVRARGLEAKRATVRSSGAGSVQVFASEALDINLSGVGSVRYFGKPDDIKRSVSGLGSVKAGD